MAGVEPEDTETRGGCRLLGCRYGVRVSSATTTLSRAQLSELRRWAHQLVDANAGGDLEALARAILALTREAERLRSANGLETPPAIAPGDLTRARAQAEAIVQNGAPDEMRAAAARAVLLLCDDIASRRPDGASASPAAPGTAAPATDPEEDRRHRTGAVVRRRRLLAAGVIGAAAVAVLAFLTLGGDSLKAEGTASAALVGAEEATRLSFSVEGDEGDVSGTTWKLDGEEVERGVAVRDGRIVYRPRNLADGVHTVEVSRGSGLFAPSASWTFTVDATAPVIRVTKGSQEARSGVAYTMRGVVEPGATLSVNGDLAQVDGQGAFAVPFGRRPEKAVVLLATDRAGNVTDSRLVVGVAPRLPRNPVRAVHVSADAWAHAGLRAELLRLIDRKKINAVELDLKDESGIVGWRSGVPLARRIGAERDTYDLRAAVKQLHERGVRVIGRLVAFRDPVLSRWAWTNGKRSFVVQTPDGGAYSGGYGGFTNFANPEVQRYNVDIAEAAAKAGVDDVLYDYVRRPDGPLSGMVVPGLEADPSDAVIGFLALARDRLLPYRTFLGASVFGIAATRPDEIAQDVPGIARVVDYVAPMVYPSHWGAYEYDIADPNAQPGLIVQRSLEDFERAVNGTGARVVPWLQDFSLGRQYGRKEVKAQIDASRAAGIDEFLLWDPEVTYTAAALKPGAPLPTTGTRASAVGSSRLVVLKPSPSPDAPVKSGLAPNELAGVPVLMYHQILPGGGSEYDLTPAEFRAELDRLYREHYRPVRASDFVNGTMDVPRGATPVVMTFDDSTASQAALLPDGSIDPDSAAGIMLDFAREHPDFRPAGTFFVNRDPFGAVANAAELARKLEAAGFELSNHTYGHTRLDELGDQTVQEEIVRGNRVISELLPKADVQTLALPLGIQPRKPALAIEGTWDGESYVYEGAFLAGAEPAPSPYSTDFAATAIPRIRSDPGGVDYGSADWFERLDAAPELRYVSDGRPKKVTFPAESASRLADAFRLRANPTG